MLTVDIPKDIKKVKAKIAFGFTIRQLLSIIIAAMFGMPVYLLTRGFVGSEIATFFLVFTALPILFVGFFVRDGIPLERYLKYFIEYQFVRPKARPYRTQNQVEEIRRALILVKAKGKKI